MLAVPKKSCDSTGLCPMFLRWPRIAPVLATAFNRVSAPLAAEVPIAHSRLASKASRLASLTRYVFSNIPLVLPRIWALAQ